MIKIRADGSYRLILSLCLIILLSSSACEKLGRQKQSDPSDVNLLLLVAKNYGLNYFHNKDSLELFGWNLVRTGSLDVIPACPPVAEQIGLKPIIPDISLMDITDPGNYRGIALMPAAGSFNPVPNPFGDILGSPEAMALIRMASEEGLAVSAVCAGVRVLAAADILQGKKVVGSPRFKEEYENAGAEFLGKDHPPAIQGHIVTGARDLYYGFLFCQALAMAIENKQDISKTKKPLGESIIKANAYDLNDDDIAWMRTFGSSGAEGGRSLCQTKDGGLLITGYTFAHGDGDADILVIKTDREGFPIWSKTFGGSGTEYGYGCAALSDGYIITGYTTSFGEGSRDVYVLKLDSQGNELWSKTIGGPSWDVGMAVCPSSDNHVYVCGYTHSYGAGEEDVYVIKLTLNGNVVWCRTYGGERFEIGHSIVPSHDGGCLIGATTGTYGQGNADIYQIRVDSEGNVIWSKSFGNKGRRGYGFDWGKSMAAMNDGGSVLAGYSDCNDIMDISVFKADDEGNVLWTKAFGNKPFYDYGNAVSVSDDGSIHIAGTTKSLDDNNDVYLAKLSSEGDMLWQKSFGGIQSDWASALTVTKTGDIIVLGHTASFGEGAYDVCLFRVKNREQTDSLHAKE
ncbi:DJ-1/PfpI family protein [Acidobacteriota bacterium]